MHLLKFPAVLTSAEDTAFVELQACPAASGEEVEIRWKRLAVTIGYAFHRPGCMGTVGEAYLRAVPEVDTPVVHGLYLAAAVNSQHNSRFTAKVAVFQAKYPVEAVYHFQETAAPEGIVHRVVLPLLIEGRIPVEDTFQDVLSGNCQFFQVFLTYPFGCPAKLLQFSAAVHYRPVVAEKSGIHNCKGGGSAFGSFAVQILGAAFIE